MFALKGTQKPVECNAVDVVKCVVNEKIEISSLFLIVRIFQILVVLIATSYVAITFTSSAFLTLMPPLMMDLCDQGAGVRILCNEVKQPKCAASSTLRGRRALIVFLDLQRASAACNGIRQHRSPSRRVL